MDKHLPVSDKHLPRTFVTKLEPLATPTGWESVARLLGYNNFVHQQYFADSSQERCYKHVILEANTKVSLRQRNRHGHEGTGPLYEILDEKLAQTEGVPSSCQITYALFVHRNKTRRILNTAQLAKITREFEKFRDTHVVDFEGMTVQEQWQIARCASLMVGVHGAGMSWFVFQPKHTAFIEFVFDGWHRFWVRYARGYRPDMARITFVCERVTSERLWRQYAHT